MNAFPYFTKLLLSTNERTFFLYPLWYYFTSEQLFGPTGSFKQLDIAITAASIDASSPCVRQKETLSSILITPLT